MDGKVRVLIPGSTPVIITLNTTVDDIKSLLTVTKEVTSWPMSDLRTILYKALETAMIEVEVRKQEK